MDSRSSATRKLSLAVLRTILTHGRGQHRGAQIPALAAVLRLSRLDGDASVRSSAFDIVAEYLGEKNLAQEIEQSPLLVALVLKREHPLRVHERRAPLALSVLQRNQSFLSRTYVVCF